MVLGACLLMSCGRSSLTNEKTTFTRADSLTETYLGLQDTLLHSWNVLVKDEEEKLQAVYATIAHLRKLSVHDHSQLSSVASRFDQLRGIQITQKTLANQYVVEEYDFATSSLISEILALAESNPALLQNKELAELVEKIRTADERTSTYRLSYDSVAFQFNTFLEKNRSVLKDIENGAIEKRPMFSVASNR
jgi:hypothetical protein